MNQFTVEECPSEDALLDYLAGAMDETLCDRIGDHLSSCPRCESVAQNLEESSGFRFPFGGCREDEVPASLLELGYTDLVRRRRVKFDDQKLIQAFQFPDYKILSVIGRGGMGVVFKALQHSTNRQVALKVIRPGVFGNEEDRGDAQGRFAKEIEAAARIDDDNVVMVFDGRSDEQYQYCAMQLIEGSSLWHRVRGGLTIKDSARYVRDAARGIDAAHRLGILHRDVKPQNILVSDSRDRALVSDFGLAKEMELDAETVERTQYGMILGTLEYISPEQLDDPTIVGPGTDIYSLGATLYYCLTGVPPFARASVSQQLSAIANLVPVAPSQLRSEIHPDLEAICLKCLEKTPAHRYATASDLAEDIDRYLSGKPTRARPTGPLQHLGKWSRRNPALTGSLVTLFALLLAGLVVTAMFNRHANKLNRDLQAANIEAKEFADKLSDSLETEQDARRELEEALAKAQSITLNFSDAISNSPELLRGNDGIQELRIELLSKARDQVGFFLEEERLGTTSARNAVLLYRNYATLARELGELKESIEQLEAAEALCRAQLRDAPQGEEELEPGFWEARLAKVLHSKSISLKLEGMREEAAKCGKEAWETVTSLAAGVVGRDLLLVETGSTFSASLIEQGMEKQADEVFEVAQRAASNLLEQIEKKIEQGAKPREFSLQFVNIVQLTNRRALAKKHETGKAVARAEKSLAILERIEPDSLSPSARKLVAGTWMNFAAFLRDVDPERSMKYRWKAINEFRKLKDRNENVPGFKFNFALSARNLANVFANQGEFEKSESLVEEADEAISELLATKPNSDRYLYGQQMICDSKAILNGAKGDFEQAGMCLNQKLEVVKIRYEKLPKAASRIYDVGFCHFQIAECAIANDAPWMAITRILEAKEWSQKLTGGARKHLDSLIDIQVVALGRWLMEYAGARLGIELS